MGPQENELAHFGATILDAFEPHIKRESKALAAALRESTRHAPTSKERRLILDIKAVLLGILYVGLHPDYGEYASTASFFASWLQARRTDRTLANRVLRPSEADDRIIELARGDYSIDLDPALQRVVLRAAEYADRTIGEPRARLRHLFVSLMADSHLPQEAGDLQLKLDAADRADLKNIFFRHIQAEPEANEKLDAWLPILDEIITPKASFPSTPPPAARPSSRAFLVSGFSADRTTDHDSDPLETEADVLAMARLICHEDADPPISIGVFGGWGSGKSTFMEALQWEVARLAAPNAKSAQPEEGPRFVSPVVQIRFNAWQFADADLWASLTAEFFDQLRAGGFEGGGKRIHGQLVEKVSEHVRGLGREAAERRSEQARADEELRTAQAEHAVAVSEKDSGVREALVSGLAEAFEKNRADLVRVGLVNSVSSDQLAQFIDVAKDVRTLSGQAKRIFKMLFRHWQLLLSAALIVAVLAWAAVKLTGEDLAGAITAAAGAAAVVLPLVRSGLKAIQSVVVETAPFADSIEAAEKKGLKAVLDSEVKVRQAREEAEALRASSERADRALARYVDPNATANPPRLLRYLLEDDPDTKAFEKEIGLLGRARRLFRALDQIVRDNRLKQEKALETDSSSSEGGADAPDPDIPARIILYIDDLDRCTHEQVYKVLQAIHLLLAFELFVVVVAVDVAWIEAALAKSIEFAGSDTESEEAKEAARQRAIEYLSKIFQLPFWLKPFAGKDDTRYAAYVRSLTRAAVDPQPAEEAAVRESGMPQPAASPDDEGGLAEPLDGTGSAEGERDEAEAGQSGATEEAGSEPVVDEVARALRTLQLTREEEDFLASPEIAALAAPDPRGVKRLVNVYKIVRSRLSEQDGASILGGDGRPPIFPIIAVCVAIETGQPIDTADTFYHAVKSGAIGGHLGGYSPGTAIGAAVAAAMAARGGDQISVAEILPVARVVRRYSFNRYH